MSSDPVVDTDDTILLDIHYKSGKTVRLRAKSFEGALAPDGRLRSVTWEAVGVEKPVFIGINDIESVWRVK